MPVQRLHDEHRDIRSMLDQLDATTDTAGAGDRESFVNLLRQLVAGLEDHFQFEEEPEGLFNELAAGCATHDRRVRQLFEQHVTLRADFRAVLGMAEQDKSIEEITPPLQAAMAALRHHERIETDFVQEAVARDLGGGD